MDGLIELSQNEFRSIDSGPVTPGSQSHATSFILPGADRCDILRAGLHAGYWCNWESTDSAVENDTLALGNLIGECFDDLPEWSQDEDSLSGFIEERGVEFYIRGGRNGDAFEIEVSVEQTVDTAPNDFDEFEPMIIAVASKESNFS